MLHTRYEYVPIMIRAFRLSTIMSNSISSAFIVNWLVVCMYVLVYAVRYAPMRVLVMTIEEEPPSLKTYDNDRQRNGTPFSKPFEDFYKKCLQKNPK